MPRTYLCERCSDMSNKPSLSRCIIPGVQLSSILRPTAVWIPRRSDWCRVFRAGVKHGTQYGLYRSSGSTAMRGALVSASILASLRKLLVFQPHFELRCRRVFSLCNSCEPQLVEVFERGGEYPRVKLFLLGILEASSKIHNLFCSSLFF